MKKFTLLFLLIAAPFVSNAQTWDFNGDDGGWTGTKCTTATNAEFLTLTFTGKNPTLSQTSANIDASAVHILAVTIKNRSESGPTYLRVSFPKTADPTKRVYKNLDISNGNTEFVTYYFDLTNDNWTGTINDIKLYFKSSGNSTFTGTGAEEMDIDKIEMLAAYPETEKHIFTFDTDGDTENWGASNATIEGVTGGVLTVTPKAGKYAKLEQHRHYVVAEDVNWVRIVLKNNSTEDDTISFITSAGRVVFPVTTSDTEFKTYELLLDTLGNGSTWTGNVDNFNIRFDGSGGKSSGTGSFDIDLIEFYAASATSISKNKTSDLTIGPNPSNGIFRLNSEKQITGYTVFNTVGQVVRQVNSLNNNSTIVNVSGSPKGIYLIKVEYENGDSEIARTVVR